MKNNFSKRLEELIGESGKSQNSVARELKIPKQKLSNWKTGYTEPALDDLILLALYFHVTADYLLGLEDETGAKIAEPPADGD